MKKSLLALAVLGAFAGAASAQSSVTIYGLVDMSVAKSNNDGTAPGYAPNAGAPGNDAWTVQQSAGSRLGFRGNEDMGGGLSAQFQIEHRFTPDDGVASTPSFWQGRSYVQITSKAVGSVYMGREYTPAFWPAVKSDPFGWDGVGQIGSNAWAGYLAPNNGGVRTSNTVGYRSANWGGLTVQAALGLSEASGAGRNNGFNVEYSGGPLYVGVGFETIKDGANNKNGVVNGAVHYDLGVVKLMGYAVQSKTANGNTKGNMYSLGLRAPIGAGVLKAQYFKNNPDKSATPLTNSKLGVGFDYFLSKRTNVYVDLGRGTGTNAAGVKLKTNTAYAVGMKHVF
jgi:predicted porin